MSSLFKDCSIHKHWKDQALKWTEEIMNYEIFIQMKTLQDNGKNVLTSFGPI